MDGRRSRGLLSDASPLSIAPSGRAPSRWISVAGFTAALGAGVVYSGVSRLHDLQAAPLGSWFRPPAP
ncbi:hypothetical protein [Methylopila sp. 73B]|uniref:hypothetical protein n=1 Tax=Methylopila sp. 73B TaxID=1120792 RepID=UPI0018CC0262|nr:hypothetical protein [Methylopila sp. 73B]